jgi:outer membrane protein assembly factor BamA
MEKAEGEPTVRVNAAIQENLQSVIERIQVAGNRVTSEKLALSQLGIEPGKPLNFEQTTSGRRALYDTGAYTLVDLSYNLIEPSGSSQRSGVKPLEATLRLREVQPFQIHYGGAFDSEHGPGGILDIRNRNTLGAARTIGARFRADAEFREGRVFFSQPLLRRFPLSTNLVTFVSRTRRPGESFDEIDHRRGFSISQQARWKDHYILNYGYRFAKLVSVQDPPDPFFPDPIRLNVAPFTVSFTRETRDDILDATRGDFLSNAFEWAPTQFGVDNALHYIRYFGQYFRYVQLSEPSETPFRGALQRSRWVYATGARVGLSRGLGGQIIPDAEKFFAGGGTTVRGFAEDELGGADSLGPIGGNAVFVLNNELRFPLHWIFDGVTFLDIGNVYGRVRDFDITDMRKSAGFGLRVRTPFFLIRADYGFKLDRRQGESAGQFFFSIGQAF